MPAALGQLRTCVPNVETLGQGRASLRDKRASSVSRSTTALNSRLCPFRMEPICQNLPRHTNQPSHLRSQRPRLTPESKGARGRAYARSPRSADILVGPLGWKHLCNAGISREECRRSFLLTLWALLCQALERVARVVALPSDPRCLPPEYLRGRGAGILKKRSRPEGRLL